MRVYLRSDEVNGTHTKFTVFMNGVNCGQLCMLEGEATFFHNLIMYSKYAFEGECLSSGHWTEEKIVS